MSKSVDNRVLQMDFENSNFESKAKDTLSTIGKLKEALKMEKATEGFERIDDTVSRFNLEPLGNAAVMAGDKFTVMGAVAFTAIERITNAAIDAGKNLVKSLSIDQVSSGWTKYEEKTQSIQTLVNSTGLSVEEINGYLEKLMWFSDETSYSFNEMTSALAQMTSSGGDIEKLIPMITGIANATAFAGKGSMEFQSTIRNLAQSYQAGYLQLQDMKSLNLMGTSSKQLKETFISIAESLDKIEKGSVTLENFDETLKDKWADKDVIEQALARFSALSDAAYEAVEAGKYNTAAEAIEALAGNFDDLSVRAFKSAQEAKSFMEAIEATKDAVSSGWMATFEIIFGSYDEAKVLWTDLANALWDAFASGAEARNQLLEEWRDDYGGREKLIESFWNVWEGMASTISVIKNAFEQVFPPMTAERLGAITDHILEITEGFKEFMQQGRTAGIIREIFHGIFSAVDMARMAISAVVDGMKKLIGSFGITNKDILEVVASIGRWISSLRNTAIETDFFANKINAFVDFLLDLPNKLNGVFTFLTGMSVGDAFTKLQDTFNNFADSLMSAYETIKNVFKSFGGIDTSGAEAFVEKIRERFQPVTTIFGAFKKIFEGFKIAFAKLTPIFSNMAKTAADALDGFADKVKNAFMNADFNKVYDIVNGGIFAGIGLGISKFVKNLNSLFKSKPEFSFSEWFGDFTDQIGDAVSTWQSKVKTDMLLKIAASVAILAGAMFVLSMLDSKQLTIAIGGITAAMTELMGAFAILGKINFDKGFNFSKMTTSFIKFSAAILILAFGMKILGSMDWDEMAVASVGISTLVFLLVASAKLMDTNNKSITKFAGQMVVLSIAVGILAIVAKSLAKMSWEQLGKAGAGIAGLITALVVAAKIMNGDEKAITKFGAQMILMGIAVEIMAKAATILAELNWEELGKAGAGIAGIVTALVVAAKIMNSDDKAITKFGGQMILMGAAVAILAGVAKLIATMSWEDMGKAGTGLVVLVGVLVAAAKIMDSDDKAITKFGGQMILMGAAVAILVGLAKVIAGMSWEELGKAGAGIFGLVAILVAAAELLSLGGGASMLLGAASLVVMAAAIDLLVPAIKILGGMSLAEIGKSLLVVVGAIAALGVAALLLAPVMPIMLGIGVAVGVLGVGMAALGAGVLAFSLGLTAMAAGGTSVILLLTMFVEAVISFIPRIAEGLVEMFTSIITMLAKNFKPLAEAIISIVVTIIDQLIILIPKVMELISVLWTNIIVFLYDHLPEVLEFILYMVTKLLEVIAEHLPDIMKAAVDVIVAFIKGIGDSVVMIVDAAFETIVAFINGLADAVEKNGPLIAEAVGRLLTAIVDAVLESISMIWDVGLHIVTGMANGIVENISKAVEAAKELGNKVWNTITDFFKIESPSKLMKSAGKFIDMGLALGITDNEDIAVDAGEELASSTNKAINSAFDKVFDGNENFNPVITPILDLSNVREGARYLNSMFGNQIMGVDTNASLQNGGSGMTFVQNNYSPKALSRTEIYRQTKNQFAALGGA